MGVFLWDGLVLVTPPEMMALDLGGHLDLERDFENHHGFAGQPGRKTNVSPVETVAAAFCCGLTTMNFNNPNDGHECS